MLTIDDIQPILEFHNQYLERIKDLPELEPAHGWAIAFTSELTSGLILRNCEYNLGNPLPNCRLWAGVHLMRYHDMHRRHLLMEGGAGLN